MLREITIGQYYATDSLLHRLDPRVKIAGTLLYIISLFLVHHYIGLVVAALVFGVMVRMSNVPFRFIVKGLKPIMMMLVFTALLHLFCTPGKAIFSLGVLHITIEGDWSSDVCSSDLLPGLYYILFPCFWYIII